MVVAATSPALNGRITIGAHAPHRPRRGSRAPALSELDAAIADCFACPRLVAWREEQARVKVARFRDETYWGRPVPGFGDPDARILLVGLAPAAHGGNRTGRVFTGDARATSCGGRCTPSASRTGRSAAAPTTG